LGAGATRTAGLKNITTKHLALASQALSFITAMIPYVREFFRRHSPGAGQMLTEFDKVKRLYQEHQHGINEKLIEIMSSRATVHVGAMKKIDWEKQSHGVNTYVETLAKETGLLQKVLSKHLPEMTVSMIMTPVFASYRDQLSKAYQEVPIRSETGKQRMLADVEFFSSRISKISEAGDLGQDLVNLVQAKPIVSEASARPSVETEPKNQDRKSSASEIPTSTANT